MSAHILKAIKTGVAGAAILTAAVNAHQYQLQQDQQSDSVKPINKQHHHFQLKNTTTRELRGVALGVLTHPSLSPKIDHFKDPNRQQLNKELLARLATGKIDHYQFHTISQVNQELEKEGLPLGKGALEAILNSVDTMQAHKGEILTNPTNYLNALWKTEMKIASEFGKEGSKIGVVAHSAKAAAETIACALLQAAHASTQAHEQKLSRFPQKDFKATYQLEKIAHNTHEQSALDDNTQLNIKP